LTVPPKRTYEVLHEVKVWPERGRGALALSLRVNLVQTTGLG